LFICTVIEKTNIDSDFLLVKLIDISGGGICFFEESKDFNVGDYVYIKMNIKELFCQIKCSGVDKIIKIDQTSKGYFYGVHFEYLDMDIRETIIKFVLEKERFLIREYKLK